MTTEMRWMTMKINLNHLTLMTWMVRCNTQKFMSKLVKCNFQRKKFKTLKKFLTFLIKKTRGLLIVETWMLLCRVCKENLRKQKRCSDKCDKRLKMHRPLKELNQLISKMKELHLKNSSPLCNKLRINWQRMTLII